MARALATFLAWLLALWLALPTRANAPPTLPVTGERIALVVGNAAYASSALLNPGNDAKAIAGLLSSAGFSVDLRLDASIGDMRGAVQKLEQGLRDPKVKTVLFYYAGHAVQLDWRNFLIGTDARIRRIEDVPGQSLDLSEMLKRFGAANTRDKQLVLVLDACRDNPFRTELKLAQRGLSQFDAPPNTLVAFSTAPGQVAFDGEGKHSFYTATLLRELAVPYVSLEDALKRVRMGVRVASLGRQIPWESTSLEQSFYLYPSDKDQVLSAEAVEDTVKRELAAWDKAKSGGDIAALVGFLQDFPNGNFSQLAQHRLDGMLHQRAQQEAVVVAQRQRGLEEEQRKQAEQEAQRAAEVQQRLQAAREAEAQRQRETQQQAQARLQALEAQRAQERQRIEQMAQAAQQERQARETAARQQAQAAAPMSPLASAPLSSSDRVVTAVQVQATPTEAEMLAVAQRLQVAPPVPLAVLAQYQPITDDRVGAVPGFLGAEPLGRVFSVGDQWSFKTIDRLTRREGSMDLRVTQVEAGADRVTYNNGQFHSDLMGNATSTNMGALDSPRQFYPATLQVGKRWVSNFVQRQSGGLQRFRYDVRVVAKENVSVPAGQFTAYRIEAQGFNMDNGTRIVRTLWVTPGVSANVALEVEVRTRDGRIEQSYRWELARYSAQRPSGGRAT